MSFLADALPFESGSRMTGVWSKSRVEDAHQEDVVTVHLIALPDDQDSDLESTLLCRFLPFHTGGLYGVDPYGKPWLVAIQHGPVGDSSLLVSGQGPYWMLQNSLERAMRHDPDARVMTKLYSTRSDLLRAYGVEGLPSGMAGGWSTTELIHGLLAEMCGVSLMDVMVGRIWQCAFQGELHMCEHDVFLDVFAQWGKGEISAK